MAYQLVNEANKGCILARRPSQVFSDESVVDLTLFDEEIPVAWSRRAISRSFQNISEEIEILRYPLNAPHVHFFMTAAVSQITSEVCGWLTRKNAFTEADLLDNEESELQDLIFRIRTLRSLYHRESYADRLLSLFKDAKEEDVSSPGITIGSLRNFYAFLQLNPAIKYPAISLTPDYNIYISWRSERSRVFSIHFLAKGETRFVLLKPDDRNPERQIRISGTATLDVLMQTIIAYRLRDWITDASTTL